MKLKELFRSGVIDQNPLLAQVLGTCPALATTTSLKNGVGMGISVIAVLICSNVVISLLRKFIPSKIRIASYVVVIAGFVTLVDMLLKAYVPSLSKSLGVFIPLIVVNCIILARAESFASKNGVLPSAADGLFMGLGYTAALVCISFVRELLGNGTLWGISVFGEGFEPALIMALPPGGFLTLGMLMALFYWFRSRKEAR